MSEGLKRRDDREDPSPVEIAVMVASVLLAASVLGYMVYEATRLPGAETPEVSVVGVDEGPDGAVLVRVEVRNEAASGLREVTVAVDCDDPAPSVTIANVPARGVRSAILACPEGTSDPQASFESLIPT